MGSVTNASDSHLLNNFTVSENHNYYIGSEVVLSHNAKPCPFFVRPKTVRSGAGVKGNFTISGYSYRVDTNKVANDEITIGDVPNNNRGRTTV